MSTDENLSQQVLIVDLRANLGPINQSHIGKSPKWKRLCAVPVSLHVKTIKSERKKKRASKIVTNSGGNPSRVNLLWGSIGVSL